MIELKFSRTINKSIDEVWQVIAQEFHQPHLWATGTSHCRKGLPNEDFDRISETESGTLMDTIINIDDSKYFLQFSVKGLPFFVSSVVSTWQLHKISENQTTLVMGPTIRVIPIIGNLAQIPMKMALKKLYPKLLNDLTIYIETGNPSPRKQQEVQNK